MNNSKPVLRVEESGVIQALGPHDLSVAASIGKYRFLGVLGHGGMADVYLAMADGPEGFRKLCVVKMLKEAMASDDDFRAMFVDEARLAARLTHPNIVQTYEVESVNGHLMLAMEYVEGATFARVRRRMTDEQFPLEAAVRVLCDVLDALSYAHNAQDFDGQNLDIVHRDVSPHNVIVGYSGNVKLLDFGIAKSTASIQATQAGVLKGKIGYMAPEQASFGEVDLRADLFSVGVMLWEAIAGRRLIEGTSSHATLLRRVEGGEPRIEAIVPDVDPRLAQIVGKALAAQAVRYTSAHDFLTDLEGWLATRTEIPRRTWAANIAAAFAEDRRKFQSLANFRGGSSPSLGPMPLGTEPPSPVMPTAPPAPVQSELPPPVAASSSRRIAIAVGFLAVAAIVGVIAYVASSATSHPPPAPPSVAAPSAGPSSVPTAVAIEATSLPMAPATATPEPASAAAPVVNRGGRRGGAPLITPPPPPPPPPATTARPAATNPETPRPATSSARPLDERDPYAQ